MIVRGTGCRDCGDEVSMLVLTHMCICMCACVHAADADVRQIFNPRGPCTQIVYTLAPKCLYRDYFRAKVSTIWAHGPLG